MNPGPQPQRFYVFFEGELLIEFQGRDEFRIWRRTLPNCWHKVYNEAYIYVSSKAPAYMIFDSGWFRADGTPCLTEQVPKELRALALLLT